MPTPFPELEPYLPGAQQQPIQGRSPAQPSTWLDREMDRQRDQRIRDDLASAPAPDAAARTSRLARDLNTSTLDVEGNEDSAERALQSNRVIALAQQHPVIGKWADANPRGMAAAADDSSSLSILGRAWDTIADWGSKVPGALRTSWDALGVQGAKINASVAGVANALYAQLEDIAQPGRLTVEQTAQRDAARDAYWDAGVANADATKQAHRQAYNGYLQETILGQGGESILPSITAGLIGTITRSPGLATSLMATSVGVPSYYDARKAGLSAPEAVRYGLAQGGTEYLTERLPAGTLVDLISRKTPFGKTVLKELGQEVVGENIATVVQDLADWAYLPENHDKTFGDYLRARPQAALDTTLATLGGTGGNIALVGSVHKAMDGTARIAERVQQNRQARAERTFLDEAARGADQSKLKQRDPEAFRDLMRAHAEDVGAGSVFIPGEAIRAYNQSEHYEPDNDPFAQSQWQDAAASGGDVVMPIEDFLTDVVGTPAWNAVKDDVRLTQGGMSTREAQTFDDAMEELMGQASEEFARRDRADRAERTTREQLVDRLASMFGESYTAPVARQYAEIAVQRAQTRAQRLGMELTPQDLGDLTVRQVMPEGLADAVSADRLDLIINAMRTDGPAEYGVGPSLLDFIQQRGGVNDVGGDLASMGVPPKYLRQYDPRQAELTGGLSGNGDYGIDNTLQAAISAGYFPDLANVENEQGPSTLDTQRLLDAINEELSGRPQYAETRTDDVRVMADQLRQSLEEAGHAPSTMSDEDIRDAVDRMSRQADEGQAYEQQARGRTVFGQSGRIIELFAGRDLSTPIHELGHTWLEELAHDAALPEAPEQLQQDWQAVRDWFTHSGHAIGEDGAIPTEAHELFARGIERYFMEGKAPNNALTRVFENVRQWMLSIYKSVASLRAEISPEIREVFDRMIASDQEIDDARQRQGIENLFKDAADAGMSASEFAAYQQKSQDANAAAHAKLLERVMSTIRRRETERYREARKGVRAEEQERIDGSPIFQALAAMDTSKGGNRISKEWIVDRMGLDALDLLPRRVPPIYTEGGANPESIAEMSGYSSATEMIEALIGAERAHRQAKEGGDKRSMRERAIENATDEEMNRRYGDLLNDGSIEREATAALQSEQLGEVISSEIRALGRKTGRGPLPYQIARDWARNKVRTGRWTDVASPGALTRHARNAAKAGKAAEAALIAGDHEEAYRQKQFQMLNNAMAAEAYAAADEVEAARKRMDKIAEAKTRKSVDQDYLEQAQSLLEAVDLKRQSDVYERRKGSFASWAAARAAEGYDVVVPENFAETLYQTNWSKMPVKDILMLDEAVKQIMHLGRLKQTLLDGQEEREWESLYQEATDSAGNIKGRPPADLAEPGWWDALKGKVLSADAALLKMETVFDWLDGGNSNGVFNRTAFRPVAEAQAREADMLKDYYARIKEHFQAVPKKTAARWNDRITLPFTDVKTERPMVLNRQQLIAMALNVGNEGNLQRLADGYRINQGALVDYLDKTLTKEEWQFVQNIWDTIDTLWPEISAMEKRVNGVAPDKVKARKFDTSTNGQMRGGYYPAIYDASRDYKSEDHAGTADDLLDAKYTKANTRASSTKARDEQVKRPILLNLGVINRHLGEVIHDITHREAVIKANRFLSSDKVRKAVDDALGREIGQQFRPWLKHVANSWAAERAGNEAFGNFMTKARANATMVGLGLRATTMISQIAGYANSVEVVGEAPMAKAITTFSAHPIETTRFVMERSGEMRHRMDTRDRNIKEAIDQIARTNPASKAAATVQDGQKFFYHGIGYMDRVVSVPTWMAAYNNALAAGMSETDAAYAGDKAVRQSQGADAAKDMAAIQRGTGRHGEALKWLTMFYSYMSAQYQRERTLARDALGADTRKQRNLPKLAARAFWLTVVPPLLTELIKASVSGGGGPDDDDESWTEWALVKMMSNAIGPIPVARDLFEPTWNKVRGRQAFNPSITPIQRAYDTLMQSAQDVGHIAHGKDTKQATRNFLESAGYLTGLVPGQAAATTQFLVDLGSGDADPQSFREWMEGLTTGKIKK